MSTALTLNTQNYRHKFGKRQDEHLNISLIVWAKSLDSVHKPQFLKRREGRAEADRTEVLLLTSLAPYR